ncbi:hypothetical protein TeGR_g9703, partial [Tetraparma gracilis]
MSAPPPPSAPEISDLEIFRSLLLHATVSSISPSTGAYKECCATLLSHLQTLLVPLFPSSSAFLLPEAPAHSPVVVLKIPGLSPSLPHILLNGHYDVVPPGDLAQWEHPPFAAVVANGRIHGRGAQDMKCVLAGYICALRALGAANWRPARTIVMTLVPDEEIGGAGMAHYLASEFFRGMGGPEGVALALDEGLAGEGEEYNVYY